MENAGAPSIAKAYAAEHGYTYTFTTKNDAYTTKLGLAGIPFFMVIGKDGRVVKTQTGVQPDLNEFYNSFAGVVKPLLRSSRNAVFERSPVSRYWVLGTGFLNPNRERVTLGALLALGYNRFGSTTTN